MGAPPSPLLLSGSLTSFSIKVNGTEIPTTFQVHSVDTWISVNRLPKARIILLDGSPATATFPISNLDTFLPGNNVVISAGYSQKNESIFTGVVVKQGIEITSSRQSRLVVELTDQAMTMTLQRKSAVFPKTTDSTLMKTLISNNGLTPAVTDTMVQYEDIVQYYASDWDLLLMRAELNGFVVVVDGGTVTVGAPNTQDSPVLALTYGDSIVELEAQMDASTQYKSSAIKSSSWDESTQQMIESTPGSLSVKEQGNVSSDKLAETFSVSTFAQQTAAMISKDELQSWSTAELLKSQLSKIRGYVKFQGSALAKTGKMVELKGLGDRFNGVAYMSSIHHSILDGRWLTTVTFGISWPWFAAEAPNISAPGASGQLPPIHGLQTGKVKQVATDPEGEFRVSIALPILGASSVPVWARLGSFYASNSFGAVFYPEVGDEVLVGFMNNDPRYPVVLGSVYSKPLPPAYPPDEKNSKKAIVTRSKLQMTFNDEDVIIEISTPKGRSVKLDDKAGEVTVTDGKNTFRLSGSGISIDSESDIKITAKGDISMSATGGLTMSAKASVSLSGNTSGEVKSSGILNIKGSMVNIN